MADKQQFEFKPRHAAWTLVTLSAITVLGSVLYIGAKYREASHHAETDGPHRAAEVAVGNRPARFREAVEELKKGEKKKKLEIAHKQAAPIESNNEKAVWISPFSKIAWLFAWQPFELLLATAVLGGSLIWALALGWLADYSTWKHVVHELSMALLISSVVGSCIETTLHIYAEERAREEIAIRDNVLSLFNHQAESLKRKKSDESDFVTRIDLVNKLRSRIGVKVDHLDESASLAYEAYGNWLLRAARFPEAKRQFEMALRIDDELRTTQRTSAYYPYTQSQIALALFKENGRVDAIDAQDKAVKAFEECEKVWNASYDEPFPHKNLLAIGKQFREMLNVCADELRFEKDKISRDLVLEDADLCPDLENEELVKKRRCKCFAVRLEKNASYRFKLIDNNQKIDPYLIVDSRFRPSDATIVSHVNDDCKSPEKFKMSRLDSFIEIDRCEFSGYWLVVATTSRRAPVGKDNRTGKMQLIVEKLK